MYTSVHVSVKLDMLYIVTLFLVTEQIVIPHTMIAVAGEKNIKSSNLLIALIII